MSFKKVLNLIAKFQTKHPYITILIILAISIAFYGGSTQVQTVASLEKMMPTQIEEIAAFNDLRDANLGQDMIAVVVRVNREGTDPQGVMDITDYRILEYLDNLQNLLSQETDILEVHSYNEIVQRFNGGEIPTKEEYVQIISNPQAKAYLDQFINQDKSITILLAKTDISADDARMNSLTKKLQAHIETIGHPSGVQVEYTGTPVIQQKLGELIGIDRRTTKNISTILVFIITLILFGTITSAIVPIIVVTISVNWLYGTMGYANIPISTLAGGVAAMVIGIGIDYAIHLMNKFKHERKKGLSIEAAIEEAVTNTGSALTGAAVATSIAFIAFLSGSMPEMGRFGLLMTIGVGYSFVLSIFGLPALLIIEERIIHKFSKKMRFGLEGEYILCEKEDIHPEGGKIVSLDKENLGKLLQNKKIIHMKRSKK